MPTNFLIVRQSKGVNKAFLLTAPAPDLEKMVASCMADLPSDAEDGEDGDDDDPDLLDELAGLGGDEEDGTTY